MRQIVRRLYSTKRYFSTKKSINTFDEKLIETVRNYPLEKEYPGFSPIIQENKGNKVRSFKDPNTKLSFFVETPGFPGCTDLGICIKLGTRDQDSATAGSLSYLKNYAHSKQTLEQTVEYYDIFQKSGSFFKFDYDTSYTYIKCTCFSEDVQLMLDLLLDLALSEKRVINGSEKMVSQITQIGDAVRSTAYGRKGLGMPNSGVGNLLTDQNFRAFQKKITMENTIFSFSNYPDEQKLIDLINTKIQSKYQNFLQRKPQPRIPSVYTGGYKAFFNPDAQLFEYAIAYQSCSFSAEQMQLMNVVKTILGSASSFSSGGPGKGMYSRCTSHLLNSIYCVEKASFINEHFNDSGLFGLTVGGMEDTAVDVVKATLDEFKKLLKPISEQELSRAKNILMAEIFNNIQGQPERLEQTTKHMFSYGRVKLHEYESRIRAVTARQIQSYLNEIVKKKPTVSCISSFDRSEKFLRQLTESRLP